MFYGARCCKAVLDNDTMNYIMFGKGTKPLVILPGLGDGLSPVHGQLQAVIFAINYKKFAEQFKVYIFSRKNSLKRKLLYKGYGRRSGGGYEDAGDFQSICNGSLAGRNDSPVSCCGSSGVG